MRRKNYRAAPKINELNRGSHSNSYRTRTNHTPFSFTGGIFKVQLRLQLHRALLWLLAIRLFGCQHGRKRISQRYFATSNSRRILPRILQTAAAQFGVLQLFGRHYLQEMAAEPSINTVLYQVSLPARYATSEVFRDVRSYTTALRTE